MSSIYVSASGLLCKPFYGKGETECVRGVELGISYVLGVGGFEGRRNKEYEGHTIVFLDEFLIRKS